MSSDYRELARRVLSARREILRKFPFYGLVLLNMPLMLDEGLDTAATDGKKLYFSPAFLSKLSKEETEFLLLHETLHVVLRHPFRRPSSVNYDPLAWNLACDIVVNSLILLEAGGNLSAISIGGRPAYHLDPKGHEGHESSAEAVYALLKKAGGKMSKPKTPSETEGDGKGPRETKSGAVSSKGQSPIDGPSCGIIDDHGRWESLEEEEKEEMEGELDVLTIRRKGCGDMPLGLERHLPFLKSNVLSWRFLLRDFLEEETTDYGFLPPDRRFPDSPFFLPSYGERESKAEDLLFCVDCSGSMQDHELAEAYAEIKGAIEELGGRLKGKLCFFDSGLYGPYPFESVRDLLKIKPIGGGGTSFGPVFSYVEKATEKPRLIVILTDGKASFPSEEEAHGIPVLWVINNEEAEPPWGRVARLTKGN